MDIPNPRPWVAGEVITASDLNSQVYDVARFAQAPPRLVAVHTVSASPATDFWYNIPWGRADVDNDGMFEGTAPTYVICRTTGWYQVSAHAAFAANGTGVRQARFARRVGAAPDSSATANTTIIEGRTTVPAIAGVEADVNLSRMLFLTAGDYLSLQVRQTSGAALATIVGTAAEGHTFLSAVWVGR